MPKLSEEQKQTYLDRRGTKCPSCGSDDLEQKTDFSIGDDGYGWIEVSCIACHAEWSDVYKLVKVEQSEEQEAA